MSALYDVLIIENNKTWQDIIKKYLPKIFNPPHIAGDWEVALNYIESKIKFDIIILDLNLSGVNGEEYTEGYLLLYEIKNDMSNVPIVVVSGKEKEDPKIIKLIANGEINAFYQKDDFSSQEFRDTVTKLVSNSKPSTSQNAINKIDITTQSRNR